ncbi:MAG: methyltransferase [Fuerstiella sp.]
MSEKTAAVTTYTTEIKGVTLSLTTHPQVFSPRRVDAGTLAMLQCADIRPQDKVLDLGCGCGVVGIYAAKIVGESQAFLIDNDPTAIAVATRNAVANHLPNLSITLSDGFRAFRETGFTRILCNPPYHTDFSVAKHFILKGFNRLQIGGEMWFVTKRNKWYRNKLSTVFGNVDVNTVASYYVFCAQKKRASYARRV